MKSITDHNFHLVNLCQGKRCSLCFVHSEYTVHLERILIMTFPHFVTLQPFFKWIKLFPPLINLHTMPHNDKNRVLDIFANLFNIKTEISHFTYVFKLFTQYFKKNLRQWLQPRVFLGITLQAWHTCIWGVSPILLCRSPQALSDWMGSIIAKLFSGLSREVRLGSSLGSGWATQGHSETRPKNTPVLSWLCS